MDWFSDRSPGSLPLIVGHRGASADAPENTLAAFILAIEQGADGIEFDVQLCADGVPVIVHDDTVDRVCDATGRVDELTLAELRQLDLGMGQGVPTLDELFEHFGRSILYNLELKTLSVIDQGLEAAVADRLRAHGLGAEVLVSSFSPFALRRIRPLLPPEIALGFLRERHLARLACRLAYAQADHPSHELVDSASMAWARRNGYRVNVWTVDEPAEARRLAGLGVDGLITNRPAFLRDHLTRGL
jgi:glycerophosphoryl diester phosphodiesterase